MAFVVDLNFASPRSGVLLLGSGLLVLVVLVAVAWAVRTGRAPLAVVLLWTATAVSVITSAVLHATVIQREPGCAELLALLVLITLAVRSLPFWQAVFGALPVCVAVLELDDRLSTYTGMDKETTGVPLLLMAIAVAVGLHLRSEDRRRLETAARVRRAERLELARDLHDHVSHYVTGIVVQAQAGEQIAERRPDTARELFGNIERTGQQGLVAMSRMVKLLRDDDATDRPEPQDSMEAVRERVAEFEINGRPASLEVGADVQAERWPTEVGRSVQRLVQEGLTNVRKHARAATDVRVLLERAEAELVVRVRNDGGPAGPRRFSPSGFGMIGLRERITALGGSISSGPLPSGGWELVARIPHE